MDEKQLDRRVRKTKRQIRNAFTALMLEKNIADITVREIAELADVNRGTFYAHYKDVNDLLAQLESGIMGKVETVKRLRSPQKSEKATLLYLTNILTLCGENVDVFKTVIIKNPDPEFQKQLLSTFKRQLLEGFAYRGEATETVKADYYFTFEVSGMMALANTWIENGMKETPAEMAAVGVDFIMRGYESL